MRRIFLSTAVILAVAGVWACGGSEPTAKVPETVEQPDTGEAQAPQRAPVEAEEVDTGTAEQTEPAAEPTPEPTPEADTAAATAEPAKEEYKGKGPDKTVIHSKRSKKGPTNFNHWGHQQSVPKCGRCHHYGKKSCGKKGCHKRQEIDAPTAKAAYHGKCIPCHRKKKVASKCPDCHAAN